MSTVRKQYKGYTLVVYESQTQLGYRGMQPGWVCGIYRGSTRIHETQTIDSAGAIAEAINYIDSL